MNHLRKNLAVNHTDPKTILDELQASKKYRAVAEAVLVRTAAWAAERYPNPKDAVKAAKRKLHQVFSVFIDKLDVAKLGTVVDTMPYGAPLTDFRPPCRDILALHASTAERLDQIGDFYRTIFAITGAPKRVLDLACGLHPFAVPWMPFDAPPEYIAVDLHHGLTAVLGRFFDQAGIDGRAFCLDLVTEIPDTPADIAFLLKIVPCLEQQAKGSAAALLTRLNCRYAVVSFPLRTLGGRDVGMARHYQRTMAAILGTISREAERIEIGNELVYIIEYRKTPDG